VTAGAVGLQDPEGVVLLAGLKRTDERLQDLVRRSVDRGSADRREILIGEVLRYQRLQVRVALHRQRDRCARPERVGRQVLGEEPKRCHREAHTVPAGHPRVLLIHPLLGRGGQLAGRSFTDRAHLRAEQVLNVDRAWH
jgi:hypothetical protein